MSLTYRLKRTGRSNHPAPPQPGFREGMTWTSGWTLRKFDPEGMMRLYGQCKTGSLRASLCRGGHRSRRYRRLWPRRGRLCVLAFFSPKFLVILSTRWASCRDVLCLGLNPNCPSRISPRSLTSCKIQANWIFSNILAIVSKRRHFRWAEPANPHAIY